MPDPTSNDVHINRPLTDVSVAYIQDQDQYAHQAVFPSLSVQDKSNDYFVWDKGDFFRTEVEKRSAGSEAPFRNEDITTQTYSVDRWSIRTKIPDEVRDNADAGVTLERAKTEALMQDVMIRREKDFVSNYMSTGVWGKDLDGSGADFTQWESDNGSPIDVITGEHETVEEKTGRKPNTAVMGPKLFRALTNHTSFIDRVKYTSQNSVQADTMATLLDVDRVVVERATENTAAEGATDSFSYINSEDLLLVHVPERTGLMQPAPGYIFEWDGIPGGQNGIRIKEYRDEAKDSDIIEADTAFDMHLVAADLGVFFTNTLA